MAAKRKSRAKTIQREVIAPRWTKRPHPSNGIHFPCYQLKLSCGHLTNMRNARRPLAKKARCLECEKEQAGARP